MDGRTNQSRLLSRRSTLDARAQVILQAALAEPAAERDAYIVAACGPNADLYAEVIEALRWEALMGDFMQEPCELAPLCSSVQTGQLLAGRFEVIRQIGEGGMGLVFEALDRKRQTRIAIKCAKPGFQRLLTPELERSMAIRHPNICRVNEIHTARAGSSEVDFLSMELLEGETLASFLRAHGKLPKHKALATAEQLCSALSAAHRTGIVHGDLKPANIFLCHDEAGALRVVITDFGLASTANVSSARGGTPGYMAPEIISGSAPSIASDIYALGLVLREIATGERSSGDEDLESPRHTTRALGMPAHWARAISRCLKLNQSARPVDASQVFEQLRVNRRRATTIAATVLLTIVTCMLPQVRSYAHDLIWPTRYVRLAIMPIVKEDEPALPPALLNDIADRLGHVRDGRRMIVTFSPIYFTADDGLPGMQGGASLGATHELRTKLVKSMGETLMQFSILDLQRSNVLLTFTHSLSGPAADGVSWQVANRVARAFGTRGLPDSEALLAAAEPSYRLALAKFWSSGDEMDAATQLLRDAARLDPASSLPLTALMDVQLQRYWSTQNRNELAAARQWIAQAEKIAPDSARVQVTAGHLATGMGDYPRSLQYYARAEQLEPGNLEALYGMIGVHARLNSPEDERSTFQRFIALYPACAGPKRAFGDFNIAQGHYAEASKLFDKAIRLAPGSLATRVAGANSLLLLGRYEDAEIVLQLLIQSSESRPVLRSLGDLRARQHRDIEAIGYFQQAIALKADDLLSWIWLGDAYRRLGRRAEATETYERAMDLATSDLRKFPTVSWLRASVGYLTARLGDEKRASDEIAQALQQSNPDIWLITFAVSTYIALGHTAEADSLVNGVSAEVAADLMRRPDLAALASRNRTATKN